MTSKSPCCELIQADCLEWLRAQRSNSIDMIFTSPPYENAREPSGTLKGKAWVDWALPIFLECYRVCRGLTAWVIEGRTRNYCYSATPILLAAELHRAGVHLRKPPIYHRFSIPGSGGPDWWRNDYELIICASHGKLPFSRNTATGKPPKYGSGGNPSHRTQSGERVNQTYLGRGSAHGGKQGSFKGSCYSVPKISNPGNVIHCGAVGGGAPDGYSSGDTKHGRPYFPPSISNPGNIISCGAVGGGHLGHKLAHLNEAPFPESLVYPFVVSFCKPNGLICDPFCGSGTTLSVALQNNRRCIGIDNRKSQITLSHKRLKAQGLLP